MACPVLPVHHRCKLSSKCPRSLKKIFEPSILVTVNQMESTPPCWLRKHHCDQVHVILENDEKCTSPSKARLFSLKLCLARTGSPVHPIWVKGCGSWWSCHMIFIWSLSSCEIFWDIVKCFHPCLDGFFVFRNGSIQLHHGFHAASVL